MATNRAPVTSSVHSFWTSESDLNDNLRPMDDFPSEAGFVIVRTGLPSCYSLPHPHILLFTFTAVHPHSRCPAIDVYLNAEHARQIIEAWEKLKRKDILVSEDFACNSEKDAERVSGVKGDIALFNSIAAQLWLPKMVHQLLAKLLEQDHKLNVQANTPVTFVSNVVDKAGRWTTQTPYGTIKAGKIIYITNNYTSQVLSEYARGITPIRGVCSHMDGPQKQ